MATRTYTVKSGDVWEWEETPAVLAALRDYRKIVEQNKKAQ